MTSGPDINALVDVDVAGWTAPRRSRVEDRDDELVVAAPLVADGELDPPIGSPVTVSWMGAPGPMELVATLVAKEERAIHRWRLRAEGPVVITQRRNHVRVTTLLSLVLHNDGRRVHGHLVDLSEGGLRAVCPLPAPFELGDRVDACFEFDRRLAEITAEIVRLHLDDERVSAGCRFVDVPEQEADLIRRFVFARQVRERALR